MFRFRITVESLAPAAEAQSLQFEVENHDDIISIARGMPGRIEQLDDDAAKAFAIGLKLFGETILKHRTNPLFSPVKPVMAEFMKNLKQQLRAKDGRAAGAGEGGDQT